MKQHIRNPKMTAWLLCAALALWGGLTVSVSAQTTKPVPKAAIDYSQLPSVRIVIPDIKMCPGEEYDLPVYLEFTPNGIDIEDAYIQSLDILVRFPDHAVVEPAYDPKNVYSPNGAGSKSVFATVTNRASTLSSASVMANYHIAKNHSFPDNSMPISVASARYKPKAGEPMLCVRVKCKQQTSAAIAVAVDSSNVSIKGGTWEAPLDNWHKPYKKLFADVAHVMPAPDPVVSVIGDTMMCVNETIRFWAEGGVSFEWEDISAMERPFLPAMVDNRSQNPLFNPKEPGYYTYRCKITNRMGCSAYDTVQCIVLNNLLNIEAPADTMVQPNTPADLSATVWGGFAPPYTLSWSPAALVKEPLMENIEAVGSTQKLWVENQSLPLTKSQWFTARLNDGFCKLETVRNVNVYGSDIEGYVQMNPSRFCVYDNIDETVKLSVRVHGGTGQYTYLWSVENLESGKPDPVLETVATEPEARLRFHSRCVVRVAVTDFVARKTTVISDTLRFDEVTVATVEIVDLNGPSSCEQTEMRFAAKSENAGDDPRYGWFINRVEALRSSDSIFSTYQLKPGDELYCELTSNKQCVGNVTAKSNVLNPNVVYPGYMTVMPSFGSDAVNKVCGDSLALGILHRNTGKKFRLRWYRNDVEVMSDRYVVHESNTGNDDVMDYTNVERIGYHDYYRAVVTESDRACLLDDSIVTMAMYPRLEPNWRVKAGDVYVHPEDMESVCSGHPFMVAAPDVRYLPSQFRLVWYVKRAGAEPIAKGYYATSSFTDNAAYGRDLGSSSEFTAADNYYRTQNWILKGFPISLSTEPMAGYNNGEADFQDGDSVFYRVETLATRCVPGHTVQSACVGVSIETSLAEVPQSLLYMSPAPPVSQFCEGTEFKFFPHPAYYAKQKEVTYAWYLNGQNIKDLYPEKFSGDTVTLAVRNGDMMMLRATTTHRCMKPGVSRISETRSRMSGMYDGFSLMTAKDTTICSGQPVALWAVGAPYKEPARLTPLDVSGVPDWLPNYEGKVKVEWAASHADALAGRFIYTGILYQTTVDSASFGDRSADFNNDSAVVGTQTFVARITSANGCVGYDSVRVTVGYDRAPSMVVVPEPAFPWCESDETAYFKLEGENWGKNPMLMMRVGDRWEDWFSVARPDSVPYIPSLHKRGAPVVAGVYSSMLSCRKEKDVLSVEMPLDLRTQTLTWLYQEDGLPKSTLSPAVCLGAELKVDAFGSTMEELQAISVHWSVEEIAAQLRDGYKYQWTDKATGAVVSTQATLSVVPEGTVVYQLTVRDTANRCPATVSEVKVRPAVETGIDFSFTDAFTGKEMPLSICEGSEATQLTWHAHPQNFSGKAYIGFAITTAESNYTKTRQSWMITNPDTAITAWFKPGDRVVYAYFHDTVSCSGEPYLMDSIDLQMGRPLSESFRGAPDMLLCEGDASARLFVLDNKENIDSLPAGAPSLKRYLLAQGIPGASALPDDGYTATGHLSPNAPLIYWWPLDGFVNPAEQTSLTPEVSPEDKAMYLLWAYNEYGCIQSDSVRVERFDKNKSLKFDLLLTTPDSVLCDSDDMFFSLDRYESSILTLFDSLVWKRVPAGKTQPEVLAKGKEIYYLHVDVAHGDTVYVEGFVNGEGQCETVVAAWFTSNKIAVQRYNRPVLTLAQVEAAACSDSTLELRATADAAVVEWLRVEGPDKGYDVLERGMDNQTAWARVRTYRDFTARATAYNHPACAAYDSVTVAVAQSLDDLYISLADPQVVCDGVPVTIEVADRRLVDSWQWILNGEYLTFDEFESEAMMQDYMLGTLSGFSGPFKAGDRIWAEGFTNSRCVRKPFVYSDTVTVERSVTPDLTWLVPVEVAENPSMRRLEACADEVLSLRLHVAEAEDFAAVWQEGDTRTRFSLEVVESDATGTVYEMTTVYPATAGILHFGAINGGCVAEDSLQIVGYPRDTLMLEVAASATSVCLGEEVHYGIIRQSSVDSVVWYVNGEPVLAGNVRDAVMYTYRPAADDRVWAVGYNTTGHCVYNNGLRSEEMSVEVTTNGAPGVIIVNLTASADSVCGAGAPVYTVTGRGFDSVYWYANGELAAITDMLDAGVKAVPTVRTATWRRAPRPAGEGPDSVYAVAVRRAKICALRNEQTTNVVSVLRREKPEVRITPRDTSVLTGYDLILEGTGASAYVWWTDAEYGIAGTMGTLTLVGHGDTVMVYTMGYEPAFNRDSLAGGQTPAPAADAYDEFTCLAVDSVLVRPAEIEVLDPSVIFIPNAVLLNSARPADRVFKVYGEDIASVHMRIFNNNGDMVFEKTAPAPVWRANDVMAGNYTYRIVITMNDGTTVNRSGWISVLD